eukprot:TRINITY_DN1662_c0_g1_i2.p1 TRINITY_DN1662_c0_g1~~TRINITY_DN1662_c0_g1_i2.p1  ORF type:complete len:229 (+),score=80.72 TRINITY_DN1662_c0_g1_i2:207-893(+)
MAANNFIQRTLCSSPHRCLLSVSKSTSKWGPWILRTRGLEPLCVAGALEAEEIGVEHLLRDVSDNTVSTLSTQVKDKVAALAGLRDRLDEIATYLKLVTDGVLPINHNIMYKIQDIFNILPLLHQQRSQKEMAIEVNDNFMTMYIASLVRSVLGIHNLINNKQELKKKKEQKEKERKEQEEKDKKEKEAKEKEAKEKEEKEKEAKAKDGSKEKEGETTKADVADPKKS